MRKRSNKYPFILGLVIIVIIYCLYNLFFDITNVPTDSRVIKHLNKLFFIGLVYGTGTIALRKVSIGWMMQLWHLVHITIIAALILIGIYDWWHGGITPATRNVANSLFDFLISPVLYFTIGMLQLYVVKSTFNSKVV